MEGLSRKRGQSIEFHHTTYTIDEYSRKKRCWQAYLDIADGFNCDVVHDNAVCQSNFWLNDAIGANGAVLDGCLL